MHSVSHPVRYARFAAQTVGFGLSHVRLQPLSSQNEEREREREKHEITRVRQAGESEIEDKSLMPGRHRSSSSESYFENDSSVAHRGQLTIIQAGWRQ